MEPLIIIGTGGTCVDILDAINTTSRLASPLYECVGFLDDTPNMTHDPITKLPVLGTISEARDVQKNVNGARFVNGIGSPTSFRDKESIIHRTGLRVQQFATIIHPQATVSPSATISNGSVILANSTICACVSVGHHVMILPNTTINHHVTIKDFCCIASGVNCAGGITMEKSCYLGAGCCIKGNLHLAEGTLVGMGSVVLKDTLYGSVLAGNPAKIIR